MHDHQRRGFNIGEGACQRKLYALVPPDGPPEYHAFLCIIAGAIEEPSAIANTLRRDQDTLGVQAIEKITEALAFFADQVLSGDFDVVQEYLRSRVVHHGADRTNGESVARSV